MPRYIDADVLLAEIQEEIDFESTMYTEEQNKYFNMGLKCAFRDVKAQPTADVVPRAEVEKWFRECEELQVRMIELEKEVAREIFEELDGIKKEFASGDINGSELFFRLYVLEKKYTEEQK